jgi:membrane protease YdiL (CAAX protease family)
MPPRVSRRALSRWRKQCVRQPWRGRPAWWHTVLVLAPIAIGSVASAYQHGLPNANLAGVSHRLSSSFTVLVEEWFGVFLVWLVLRRHGLAMGSLVSGHWQTPRAFFRDLGLAIGFMVVVVPVVGGPAYLLGANTNSAVANILPKTVFELVVFLALTASASFREELVFRGYLRPRRVDQPQSAAMTSPARAGCHPANRIGLNDETYEQRIQPRLAGITYSAIASALGVSMPYAADIRAGRRRPHPRHWQTLAKLVGVSAEV